MPWADATCPQASLGALAAYLREREPAWEITAEYAYLDIAAPDLPFYQAVAVSDFEGERVYATLMHPERTDQLTAYWARAAPETLLGKELAARAARGQDVKTVVSMLRSMLDGQLDTIVASRSWDGVVVGLTTSFSQLFANIALAQRIKAVAPTAVIVLGGSTVSPVSMADSVLATYPCVDYIVRGEGELPFHALCTRLATQTLDERPPRGVVSRQIAAEDSGMWQVDDLDALPIPDYDGYYQRVASAAHGFLPIEGSRGCWWDRTTKNATSTCHFCNLNVQWDGYRQKSGKRIALEMRTLAGRYRKSRFAFLDNVARVKGFDELVDALSTVGLDPEIFHEARANLRPEQIARFFECGLRRVQFGLEGLSNAFLDRIHKGTSVIMNLEAMKTCAELRIKSFSNLIVAYPGSTDAEVEETLQVINDYAFAYEPPNIATFELGVDSVVAKFPERAGVVNVRKHDLYAAVIDPAVLATLATFQLSFDHTVTADWSRVVERVTRWKAEYRPHPLAYEDGGSYLRIYRRRVEDSDIFELDGEEAALYRYCLRIRKLPEIHAMFAGDSPDHAAQLDATLARLVGQRLVYQDGAKFLALAVAPDPVIALKRIRAQPVAPPPVAQPVRRLQILR